MAYRPENTPHHLTADDLLDDSAYLSAIDNDLFKCTTNKKHDEKSPKLMHEIKFAYESPTCSTSPDNIGENDHTPPVTALSDDTDIPAAQRSCPDFKDTVGYLDTGTLPDSDVAARKVILESDQYTMVDGRLHHLYAATHRPTVGGSTTTHPLCNFPLDIRASESRLPT